MTTRISRRQRSCTTPASRKPDGSVRNLDERRRLGFVDHGHQFGRFLPLHPLARRHVVGHLARQSRRRLLLQRCSAPMAPPRHWARPPTCSRSPPGSPPAIELLLFLIVIALDNWTINVLNLYTGGLSLSNIFERLGRFWTTVIISALGIALSATPECSDRLHNLCRDARQRLLTDRRV